MELAGWPESRTIAWSQRFQLMDDPESMFYHYSALYYVADLLVPSAVSEIGGKEHSHFQAKIEIAIHGGDFGREKSGDFNWREIRPRLEDLFRSVGSSLHEVGSQLAEFGS